MLTRDQYVSLKNAIPNDRPNHFISMFAVELARTDFEESFDIRKLNANIEELSKIYDVFSELKSVHIPEKIAESINDRLLFLKFEIDDEVAIDAKREVHIIRDIVEVASKEKIFLDLKAILLIKREIKLEMRSSSKFKLLKTCLLAKLFPYMQSECDSIFREKLAYQIKLWVEVWKRYNNVQKELDNVDMSVLSDILNDSSYDP